MTVAQRPAWFPFTALLTTAALHAPLATAAETPPRDMQVLQEIIVTATKRSERLQDVPIAVSAITGDDILARGFTNYSDYLNSVPGVYFQDLGAGHGTIRIRGISASEGGVPSTTATYFGETVTSVLTNQGGKPNLRLVDIDRVEVLRGPQGTLFGASALAGVVRIIPKSPDLQEFEANVGARGFTTAHSDDASYHAEAAVNIPLVTDKLALRVVGYQDDIAGFIDNEFEGRPEIDWSAGLGLPDGTLVSPAIAPFTRRDINSQDTWGVRGTLKWQATDRLSAELMHTTQDVTVNSEEQTDPLAVGKYSQSRGLDPFEEGGNGERLSVNTLVVNYDWDAVSLISASSWVEMKRFSDQDIAFLAEASGLPPLPWGLHDSSEGELFTQEVRVQSRGDQPLQWTVGAYFQNSEASFAQFVPDYSCPACLGQVARGQDFELDAPLCEVLRERAEVGVRTGQLRHLRAVDGRRRRSLPGRRHHRLRHLGRRLPDPRIHAGPHDSGAAAERQRGGVQSFGVRALRAERHHYLLRAGGEGFPQRCGQPADRGHLCRRGRTARRAGVHGSGHAVELRARRQDAGRRWPPGHQRRGVSPEVGGRAAAASRSSAVSRRS